MHILKFKPRVGWLMPHWGWISLIANKVEQKMDRMWPMWMLSLHEGTYLYLLSMPFLTKFKLSGCRYGLTPESGTVLDRSNRSWLVVTRPELKGIIYLQDEGQKPEQRPTKRTFGRAHSGVVFQRNQALGLNSVPGTVPMLHLFHADMSLSGAHGMKHPVYGALFAYWT